MLSPLQGSWGPVLVFTGQVSGTPHSEVGSSIGKASPLKKNVRAQSSSVSLKRILRAPAAPRRVSEVPAKNQAPSAGRGAREQTRKPWHPGAHTSPSEAETRREKSAPWPEGAARRGQKAPVSWAAVVRSACLLVFLWDPALWLSEHAKALRSISWVQRPGRKSHGGRGSERQDGVRAL